MLQPLPRRHRATPLARITTNRPAAPCQAGLSANTTSTHRRAQCRRGRAMEDRGGATKAPREEELTGCGALPQPPSPLRRLEMPVAPPPLENMEKKLEALERMRDREWNTRDLGKRVGADAAAALSAGALVAPLIAMIDRCVIVFGRRGRAIWS
ncbi:MAG: hypothetical protein INR71_03095 [Terriglobus roseus]|nr:hypothetical protein [Terriglobus roseus]